MARTPKYARHNWPPEMSILLISALSFTRRCRHPVMGGYIMCIHMDNVYPYKGYYPVIQGRKC